jgi:hypothetical protein
MHADCGDACPSSAMSVFAAEAASAAIALLRSHAPTDVNLAKLDHAAGAEIPKRYLSRAGL